MQSLSLQHGHVSGNYMSSQKMQHKKNVKSKEYDDYSHYSDENFGNYNEEEKDEDFADQLKQYRQAKETSSGDLGPPFPKEPVKKQGMKGIQKGKGRFGGFLGWRPGWGKQPGMVFLEYSGWLEITLPTAKREGFNSFHLSLFDAMRESYSLNFCDPLKRLSLFSRHFPTREQLQRWKRAWNAKETEAQRSREGQRQQ